MNFNEIVPPAKPVIPKSSLPPLKVEALEALKDQGSFPKLVVNTGDTDPKSVLKKLEKILSELMNTSVLSNIIYIGHIEKIYLENASPDEKKIPTLPLLKILESYDEEKTGYLDKLKFRHILIETFPVFTRQEIDTLVHMASQLGTGTDKVPPSGQENADPYIRYYYFLLQVEKYFELNQLCQQYS